MDLGFANFPALLSLPYALIVAGLSSLGLGAPGVGRAFYLLELLMCGYGTFALSWLVVRRAIPEARPLAIAASAGGASIFASYNILTAILLLYPPSTLQFGLLVWPSVVAGALAIVWHRPTIGAGIAFGFLCAFATMANPAHTMLGFATVASIFVVDAVTTRRPKYRVAIATLGTMLGLMTFMWLPTLAARFLYGSSVSAYEAGDPGSLARSELIITARTSFLSLLHFDGLNWWPVTRNAELYAAPVMVILTAVPAFLTFVALRRRSTIVRWFWLAAIVALFLAKSIHPPLPLNELALEQAIPLFVAFRQHYDKFAEALLVTLPPLFAVGAATLAASGRRIEGWACVLVLACVASTAWPFLAGRVAEPSFLTTVPDDYRTVDGLLDENSRAISLPGAPGNINILSWYKGANFENLIFRAHVFNSAVFKELPISAATLYDDDAGIQAQELPRLTGALGLYGFDHILLHKDYLTSYRMAWDFERYKVLGPLTAIAMERVLDADPRLVKQFEGSNLVLYRIKPEATLGHAYATDDATLTLGYEDTMLPLSDAGVTDARNNPLLLFLGNQDVPLAPDAAARYDEVLRRAGKLAVTLPIQETPALYRQQVILPAKRFALLGPRYLTSRPPAAFVFAAPHGDFMLGSPPERQNLSGRFALKDSLHLTPVVQLHAERVRTEVSAQWFGTESGAAWPVSSYGDEAVPDDDLALDAPLPRVGKDFVPPAVRVGLNGTSASYQIQLHADGATPELAVAGAPMATPLALLDDPRVSLGYEVSDPSVEQVFLRAVLRRDDGYTLYVDSQLDGSGSLDDWSVREAAQQGLDDRFRDTLWLHQTDPTWLASQRYFNAEQAEAYRLVGLRLVFGKRPGLDMRGHPGSFSVVLRSLRVALNGSPSRSYVARGFAADFGAAQHHMETNLPSYTETTHNGALLVNAVVREQTEGVRQPLEGRSVTFRLHDGTTLIGDLVRDTPDGYVLQTDFNQRQVVSKAAVASIIATGPARLRDYSVTMSLPAIDIARYPNVHVRYWTGTTGIRPDISLDVATPDGKRTVRVTSGANDAPDATIPDTWIHLADFPGLDSPLVLNGFPTTFEPDTGWREAIFDLRELAAQHTGYVGVRPISLTVKMSMAAGADGTVSAYAFGFGDVVFAGSDRDIQRDPRDTSLLVDSMKLKPVSADTTGDVVKLTYPPIDLGGGGHTLSTVAVTPWSVLSASLVDGAAIKSSAPHLALKRIDDELYAVHLDRGGPTWISFAESFHNGWRLVPASEPANRVAWLLSWKWLLQPAVRDHVVGNGYGNAWYVDGTGGQDYVIDFAPQNFVRIGEVLSLAIVMLGLMGAALAWRRS